MVNEADLIITKEEMINLEQELDFKFAPNLKIYQEVFVLCNNYIGPYRNELIGKMEYGK